MSDLRFNLCRALAPRMNPSAGQPANFGRDERDSIMLDMIAAQGHKWHGEPTIGVCLSVDPAFRRNVIPPSTGPDPFAEQQRDGVTIAGASMAAFITRAPFNAVLREGLGPLANATRIIASSSSATMPVGTGAATGVPTIEAPGADAASSTPTFIGRKYDLQMIDATVRVTRASFFSAASGDYDLDALIQAECAGGCADKLLAMIATGSGTVPESQGFQTDTNVPTHAEGASGGPFVLADATACEKAIGDVNAERAGASLAWWTTTAARAKLRATQKFANVSDVLWTDEDTIIGKPAFASTVLPSNLTKSSGSNLSMHVYGAWIDYGVAIWSPGAEFIVDPYRLKAQNLIEITCRLFAATRPIRDTSFIKIVDIVTT